MLCSFTYFARTTWLTQTREPSRGSVRVSRGQPAALYQSRLVWFLTAFEWLASSWFSCLPDLRLRNLADFYFPSKYFRPKRLESSKRILGLVIWTFFLFSWLWRQVQPTREKEKSLFQNRELIEGTCMQEKQWSWTKCKFCWLRKIFFCYKHLQLRHWISIWVGFFCIWLLNYAPQVF